MNITSDWTRQIESGKQPSQADLINHLNIIHQKNAGFTENIASNCRDKYGNNSYDLLLNTLDKKKHFDILDIACGSGFLLDLCHKRFGDKLQLTGIDMSYEELELARLKLSKTNTIFHQSMAQNLKFLTDNSFDVILCHWALTLMDPVVPVFDIAKKILRKNGVFAAIIDGDVKTSPDYLNIHNIIYKYVQEEYPNYGSIELGDSRVRNKSDLNELAEKVFFNSKVTITNHLLYFNDYPKSLATEVAGFFYASFVLSNRSHKDMLIELEEYFSARSNGGISCFTMPINRLLVINN